MQCFDDFVAGSYETQSVPDVAEYSHLREDIRIDDAPGVGCDKTKPLS